VPLRLIAVVLPEEALLLIVNVPVTAPAVAGSKPTESVNDCPGFNVAGNVAPEMLKPLPDTDAALMVSEAVPDDVSVTDREAAVFTDTEPNPMLLVLRVRAGVVVVALAVSRRV